MNLRNNILLLSTLSSLLATEGSIVSGIPAGSSVVPIKVPTAAAGKAAERAHSAPGRLEHGVHQSKVGGAVELVQAPAAAASPPQAATLSLPLELASGPSPAPAPPATVAAEPHLPILTTPAQAAHAGGVAERPHSDAPTDTVIAAAVHGGPYVAAPAALPPPPTGGTAMPPAAPAVATAVPGVPQPKAGMTPPVPAAAPKIKVKRPDNTVVAAAPGTFAPVADSPVSGVPVADAAGAIAIPQPKPGMTPPPFDAPVKLKAKRANSDQAAPAIPQPKPDMAPPSFVAPQAAPSIPQPRAGISPPTAQSAKQTVHETAAPTHGIDSAELGSLKLRPSQERILKDKPVESTPHSRLMEEIQKGKSLKKVAPNESKQTTSQTPQTTLVSNSVVPVSPKPSAGGLHCKSVYRYHEHVHRHYHYIIDQTAQQQN